MMQTLSLLGVPIIGNAFDEYNSCRECNPKGYWELPVHVLLDGVNLEPYDSNCAIKLFGGALVLADPSKISKIILCVRDEEEAIVSTMNWLDKQRPFGFAPDMELASKLHADNRDFAKKFIMDNPNIDCLVVDFNDFVEIPCTIVKNICQFLSVKSVEKMENAIKNVDVRTK